jgi:putative transposase
MAGKGAPSPLLATRHQLLLGDDAFVEQPHQNSDHEELRELSKAHRRSLALPLENYEQRYTDRNEAMAQAYHCGALWRIT